MREPGTAGGAVWVASIAIFRRLAAGDQILLSRLRAGGRSKLPGLRINRLFDNSRRWFKVLRLVIRRQRNRALHELAPDRRRSRAASQPKVAIVVKSDPDHTKEIRSV